MSTLEGQTYLPFLRLFDLLLATNSQKTVVKHILLRVRTPNTGAIRRAVQSHTSDHCRKRVKGHAAGMEPYFERKRDGKSVFIKICRNGQTFMLFCIGLLEIIEIKQLELLDFLLGLLEQLGFLKRSKLMIFRTF